ncbi:hypothetical protein JCM18899A_25210 [Nocardioides sp. AN3]
MADGTRTSWWTTAPGLMTAVAGSSRRSRGFCWDSPDRRAERLVESDTVADRHRRATLRIRRRRVQLTGAHCGTRNGTLTMRFAGDQKRTVPFQLVPASG